MLAPYEPYLQARWTAGCHNAYQLWREILNQGFTGQAANVRRYVAQWRPTPGRPRPPARTTLADASSPTQPAQQPTPVLSPRQARWLLLHAEESLTPTERAYRTALIDAEPTIREAQQLTSDFGAMMRTRDGSHLLAWLDRVYASDLPELRAFAAGIQRDRSAVEAALTSTWSNGQTEGQINRLKVLKGYLATGTPV